MISAAIAWLGALLPGARDLAGNAIGAFRSTWFIALMVAAAFAAWTLWIWHEASGSARAECQAAALQSRIAVLERQLEAANASAKSAERAAAERESAALLMQKERDAYAAYLATRPLPPSCAFDARDVDRLMRRGPAARPRAGGARNP